MRFVAYNPMWPSHERHEDIRGARRGWDVIMVAGTKSKGVVEAVTQGRMGYHWGVKGGWRMGKQVNNSSGISIMVSNRYPKSCLQDVYGPRVKLRG